jgi:hypothetical protein
MTVLLTDPGDSAFFEMDWSDALGTGVTLSSVAHSVPTGLTLVSEATDTTEGTSAVRVTGTSHGQTYLIQAAATLSNGEVINRQFPLRSFNG